VKTFFVPIIEHDGLDTVVATAALAAERFAGVIEGSCILPALADYLEFADELPWSRGDRTQWADRLQAEELAFHEAFAAALTRRAIREAGTPGSGPCYRWHAGPLAGDHAMSQYSRLFSVTVVKRPAYAKPSFSTDSFEALLFEGGRPVLISPPTPPTSLGENILIAWNSSTEAARAVALAMPFLRQAKHVVVLQIEGSNVPGPSAQEFASALKEEGIPARGRTIPASELSSGEVFLLEARALGCDLLIKGAYTQSRLRQFFFGGATSHILHHANLPVLMAH
jgi:nucleotide-binding universal stress UspA family protein